MEYPLKCTLNMGHTPIKEYYTGKVKKINIVTERDKQFHTQLQKALHKNPNFAGHYFILQFGCGASCISSVTIDTKTGDIFWLPFTVSNYPLGSTPINYRLDSSLLEIMGSRNEEGQGKYYYKFESGSFILTKEFPL